MLNLDYNHLTGWNTTQTFYQLNDDLIIDFGDTYGILLIMNNQNWVQLYNMSAKSIVTGDIDGNGQDVIFDSDIYGVWAWMNNSRWVLLLPVSPESMVVGDLDGNGQDEVIIDLGSKRWIWLWMNN
ncbi:MAG: hypothetical protein ABFS56_13890 [Pseudomonadota bacterium]